MNTQKLIIIALYLCVQFSAATSFSQVCKPLNELKWPDELIYFYFNQPGLKIIPIPSSYCLKNQIEIKNTAGKPIGQFKIKSNTKSNYNDYTLKSKKTSKVITTYHKTISSLTNPYLFTDFIFNLLKTKLINNYKLKIQFIYGELTNLNTPIMLDPYEFSLFHWNAKNINYDQLIQFYAKPDVDFINFSDEDGYFFPKAVPYTQYLSKYIRLDLLDLVFENNLKAPKSGQDIVIYSTTKNTLKAYNLISKLYVKNSTNVYWFNTADAQWVNSKTKDIYTLLKKVKITSTEDLISNLKTKTKFQLLDISDPEASEVINFKNSIVLNPQRLFGEKYKSFYLKINTLEAYNKLSENTKKSGDYIFYGLNNISKDTKLFIIGHHRLNPLRSNEISKSISRLGYKDVNIVLDSAGEILQKMKAFGLNPSDYIFEKNLPPKSIGSFIILN